MQSPHENMDSSPVIDEISHDSVRDVLMVDLVLDGANLATELKHDREPVRLDETFTFPYERWGTMFLPERVQDYLTTRALDSLEVTITRQVDEKPTLTLQYHAADGGWLHVSRSGDPDDTTEGDYVVPTFDSAKADDILPPTEMIPTAEINATLWSLIETDKLGDYSQVASHDYLVNDDAVKVLVDLLSELPDVEHRQSALFALPPGENDTLSYVFEQGEMASLTIKQAVGRVGNRIVAYVIGSGSVEPEIALHEADSTERLPAENEDIAKLIEYIRSYRNIISDPVEFSMDFRTLDEGAPEDRE